MNSLDAHASNIFISVDLDKYSVSCTDDGTGINTSYYESLVPSTGSAADMWYCTSKSRSSGASYGFRGEALAAMATLGNLDIESKCSTSGGVVIHTEKFKSSAVVVTSYKEFEQNGTKVHVKDIFSCCPVRRKALQKHSELTKIKEFVRQISIIRHNVTWNLYDAASDEILFKVSGSRSVASRISAIFGSDVVCNMIEVSSSISNISLTGFISPPVVHTCK